MPSPPLVVAVVIGTRPEAIKLLPIVLAARRRPEEVRVRVIRTGQHRELVDRVLREFDVRSDVNLGIMQRGQDLSYVLAESVRGLSAAFSGRPPDWVLVQGDTTSALAGALAAFYNHVPVGHVEAGLRTGDLESPFPEEANRSLITRLARLHFAPTEGARANLRREGIADPAIFVTGNTVIDALTWALEHPSRAAVPTTDLVRPPYVLVTAHRRESRGAVMHGICDAVLRLVDSHPTISVLVSMHPSPEVRDLVGVRLGRRAGVVLTEPLGYLNFVSVMRGAALVLTDSGGIQEECAALGKPVVVMRGSTERPEAVDAGVAVLGGTEAHRIFEVASALLLERERATTMARPTDVFGKGTASTCILDALRAIRAQASYFDLKKSQAGERGRRAPAAGSG